MNKKIRFPKIYFGWWTVIASGLLALWGHGFHAYGISALFKPISTELGFSRTLTSIAASIGRLEGGFEAPLSGWITDRYGPKWIVFFGTFLISLGLILMFFIDSLWSFYVVWGILLGTGVNVALAVPLDTAISKWFIKKRGVALSIKWTFSGISGVVVLPLVAWLITIVGWRSACMIGGLAMGFIGLPLVLLCFKTYPPEYYGLLPDGAKISDEKTTDHDLSPKRNTQASQGDEAMIRKGIEYAAEVSEVEFSFKQSLKTPAYWLLILVQSVHGLVAPAINIHCIAFLTDRGISPIVAAGMQAIMLTCSIPARFIGGFIADRIDKDYFRYYVAAATFLQALGIGIFMFHQTITTIYIWFILYGLGMGAGMTLKPSMRARYFGRKAFGTIQGTSIMFLTPVGIVAPIYAGWIYDTTGSYLKAFSLFTVLLTVASVIIYFVKPPKAPAALEQTK